jgi:hypothetical protein
VVQWKTTDSNGISKEGQGTDIGLEFLNKKVDTAVVNTKHLKENQDYIRMLVEDRVDFINDSLKREFKRDSATTIGNIIKRLKE